METVQPTTSPSSDQRWNAITRILAFLAGAFILVVGAPFSLGTSLLAPIAMVIASAIWRRRGRRLTVLGHWLAAACGAVIVFVLIAGVVTTFMPKGSWSRISQAADSAQKAPQPPPPAWLERLSPGIGARQAAAKPPSERAQMITIAFGAALLSFFFVGLYGSIAWGGGMLVGYGVNGRWPGSTGNGEQGTTYAASSPVPRSAFH